MNRRSWLRLIPGLVLLPWVGNWLAAQEPKGAVQYRFRPLGRGLRIGRLDGVTVAPRNECMYYFGSDRIWVLNGETNEWETHG